MISSSQPIPETSQQAYAQDEVKGLRCGNASGSAWLPWITLGAGVVMLLLVLLHVHGLDGPPWHRWKWRRLRWLWTYGLFAIACIPLLAALWLREVRGRRIPVALVLSIAVMTSFACRIASILAVAGRWDLSYIVYAVQHPDITSYYTDAVALSTVHGWAPLYAQILPMLHLHSISKPIGPVFYYWIFVSWFGANPSTALLSGLVIGAFASMAVPPVYWLLRVLVRRESPALWGACFFALCPGYLLFFPMLDPVYPALISLLLILWILAIERQSRELAFATGVAVGLIAVITFNFLVIGLFIAGFALFGTDRDLRSALWIALSQSAIALVGMAAVTLLLYMVTGYSTPAVFASAWRNQHQLMALHAAERPYPTTIVTDLLDFALGSAWIAFLLAGVWIYGALRRTPSARITRVVCIAVAQIVIVAVTGLLQSETSRVWNFMLPLLALPVGLQLEEFKPSMRLAIVVCEALIMTAICQNMIFIG